MILIIIIMILLIITGICITYYAYNQKNKDIYEYYTPDEYGVEYKSNLLPQVDADDYTFEPKKMIDMNYDNIEKYKKLNFKCDKMKGGKRYCKIVDEEDVTRNYKQCLKFNDDDGIPEFMNEGYDLNKLYVPSYYKSDRRDYGYNFIPPELWYDNDDDKIIEKKTKVPVQPLFAQGLPTNLKEYFFNDEDMGCGL